jgi:hypothetical protein
LDCWGSIAKTAFLSPVLQKLAKPVLDFQKLRLVPFSTRRNIHQG